MFVELVVFCFLCIHQSLTQDMDVLEKFQKDLNSFCKYYVDYNKSYESMEEFVERFQYFRNTLSEIEKQNANEHDTATYAVNKFSDYNPEERKRLFGYRQNYDYENIEYLETPDVEIPENFDWRDHNAVTHVKNQGQCNDCWIFSAVGNIEGQYAIKHKKLIAFSEQEVVSCSDPNETCATEGTLPRAYDYMMKLGGLETEKDYPYTSGAEGKDYPCKMNTSKIVAKVKGYYKLSSNEDDMAKWLYKNGPIAACLEAHWMLNYAGGIAKPSKSACGYFSGHCVLLVGFGVERSESVATPYWIIKNSWGDKGFGGYYLLERGIGACGINLTPETAVVD